MTDDKLIHDITTLPLLITAGNALLTFESIKTGKHHTFHFSEHKDDQGTFYSVRANNKIIGHIKDMALHYFPRTKVPSPEQGAMAWIWRNVLSPHKLEKYLRVYHNGRCAKCGRKLTTPESINRGLGPDCFESIFKI